MTHEITCPGCRLRMPVNRSAAYTGYYNCSAECWSVYSDVLGVEFVSAVVFAQVHQMTVDSYALQHAGGPHPDKSVGIHLAGLHATFERNVPQSQIPKFLQRLAETIEVWPHYPAPGSTGPLNIMAIALSGSEQEHMERVRKWARFVWHGWSDHHAHIARLVQEQLR